MYPGVCVRLLFTVCGARYKTRPGLTYHYTHSHKDGRCGPPSTPVASASSSSSSTSQLTPSSGVIPSTVTSSSSSSSSSVVPPPLDQDDDAALPPPSPALLQSVSGPDTNHPTQGWTKLHDSYLTYLNTPGKSYLSLLFLCVFSYNYCFRGLLFLFKF